MTTLDPQAQNNIPWDKILDLIQPAIKLAKRLWVSVAKFFTRNIREIERLKKELKERDQIIAKLMDQLEESSHIIRKVGAQCIFEIIDGRELPRCEFCHQKQGLLLPLSTNGSGYGSCNECKGTYIVDQAVVDRNNGEIRHYYHRNNSFTGDLRDRQF